MQWLMLLICAVICAGCNEKQIKHTDIHAIEIIIPDYLSDERGSKELDFATVCDSLIYIVLETTQESLISNIDRVYYTNRYVYVLDRRQNKLLQFTMEGQFVKQIGAMGRGPGEYSRIFDFTINSTNENLILLCEYKVIEIETTGTFVKELKLKQIYHSFLHINNSLWLFPYDGDFCATLMDYTSGEVIDNAIPRSQHEKGSVKHVYRNVTYGPTAFFVDYWDYMVYTFTGEEAIPIYNIDFGKRSVSQELKNNNKHMTGKDYIDFLNSNNYIYNISNFIEGNRYVFFRFEPGKYVFYDKESLKFNVASSFNDKTTALHLSHFVESASSQASYLTNVLQPRLLTMGRGFLETQSTDERLLKIIASINEGDNPVLMKYYLR